MRIRTNVRDSCEFAESDSLINLPHDESETTTTRLHPTILGCNFDHSPTTTNSVCAHKCTSM